MGTKYLILVNVCILIAYLFDAIDVTTFIYRLGQI